MGFYAASSSPQLRCELLEERVCVGLAGGGARSLLLFHRCKHWGRKGQGHSKADRSSPPGALDGLHRVWVVVGRLSAVCLAGVREGLS